MDLILQMNSTVELTGIELKVSTSKETNEAGRGFFWAGPKQLLEAIQTLNRFVRYSGLEKKLIQTPQKTFFYRKLTVYACTKVFRSLYVVK